VKKKSLYFDLAAYFLSIPLAIILFLTILDTETSREDYNSFWIAFWFNLYFLSLGFLYWTKIYFKVDEIVAFSNSYLAFPMSRFGVFIKEYKQLAVNPAIIILSVLVFLAVITQYHWDDSLSIFRWVLIFILQYHFLHWIFLFVKNIFQSAPANLLSVFLFVQLMNSAALSTHQSALLLNPVTGWLMAPELFSFSIERFCIFIVIAVGIAILLYKLANKHVKWLV
jgi:hypothetical protein